jgi:Metallo-beta-lactamase superfamily
METMMTPIESADAGLSWDVLTIRRPGLTRDLPAGKEELMWVANSSTLIHGFRDAVLVDTFLTIEQSQTLLNWGVASGKDLTATYVTYAHGDHFFGLAPLLERFPHARAVATPEVVKAMHEQLSPASVDASRSFRFRRIGRFRPNPRIQRITRAKVGKAAVQGSSSEFGCSSDHTAVPVGPPNRASWWQLRPVRPEPWFCAKPLLILQTIWATFRSACGQSLGCLSRSGLVFT